MSPLEKAKYFLENNRLAAIATVSGFTRTPQIAAIYYIYDHGQLYFATERDSRKAKNVLRHKKLALLIVQDKQLEMLQLEGYGKAIDATNENLRIIELLHENLRRTSKYDTWPALKLNPTHFQAFRVDIERFKYSNFSGEQIVIEGTPSDWNESSRISEDALSHKSSRFHSRVGSSIKKK